MPRVAANKPQESVISSTDNQVQVSYPEPLTTRTLLKNDSYCWVA